MAKPEVKFPDEWIEVSTIIVDISKELRLTMTHGTETSLERYHDMLNKLTGAYMFFTPLFKHYSALKMNNDRAKYLELKNAWNVEQDGKFVSKTAEYEASAFVKDYRLARDWLEGQMLAAEKGFQNIKKQIDTQLEEQQLQKKSN